MSWGDYRNGGSGGGLLIPKSALIPFADNSSRDIWAAANLNDLVKDTSAVNVIAGSWFVWRGDTNPSVYDSSLWVNGDEIVKGEHGAKGDNGADGAKGDTVKISSVTNTLDGTGKLQTTVSLDDGTSAESEPLQLPESGGVELDGSIVKSISTDNTISSSITDDRGVIGLNAKISPWKVKPVPIGDNPLIIDGDDLTGYEYQFNASTDESQSAILYTDNISEGSQVKISVVNITNTSRPVEVHQTSLGGEVWPVITPTMFTLRDGVWRVEESSQMLHVYGASTYGGVGAIKSTIHGIAVDPSSDLTAAVSEDGLLVLGRTYTPPTDTIDIAFWWSDNPEPDANDILNAMSQTQTVDVVSHTDDFYRDDLQKKTMTARRDENSFKYLFFAWHKGFFNPEPTKVDTGWGAPSTWLETEVSASGVLYKVLTVEVKNNSKVAEDYALVQEGIR